MLCKMLDRSLYKWFTEQLTFGYLYFAFFLEEAIKLKKQNMYSDFISGGTVIRFIQYLTLLFN